MNIISAFRQQFFSKFYLFVPISIIALACFGLCCSLLYYNEGELPLQFFSNGCLCSRCYELFGCFVGTIQKRNFI